MTNEGPEIRLHFDRRVPPGLVAALRPGGPLEALVDLAVARSAVREGLDLQFRADPRKPNEGRATLYVGLSKALDLDYRNEDEFRVCPQKQFGPARNHWAAVGARAPRWTGWQPLVDLKGEWADVMRYARETVEDPHTGRYVDSEGHMQAALSRASEDFAIIDRESEMGFDSKAARSDLFETVGRKLSRIQDTLRSSGEKWTERRHIFGGQLDALAVDTQGRVLVIEVKPGGETSSLAWTPVQVSVYRDLFERWAGQQPEEATQAIRGMLQQRIDVGLEDGRELVVSDPLEFVPVIAVGGMIKSATVANHRMRAVWEAIDANDATAKMPEIWQFSGSGAPTIRPLGDLEGPNAA